MMKIPRYWAKETQEVESLEGKKLLLSCWRWSDRGVDEARRFAGEGLQRIIQKIHHHEKLDRYAYSDRLLREEIIQEITNAKGQQIGAITRNAYGALILNTSGVMFMDIDFAPQGLRDQLSSWFGKKKPSLEDAATEKVKAWAERQWGYGIKIYRTYGGLRCMVTHQVFDPASQNTLDILNEVGSDPLYMKLCAAQECFRARLTPKPWRCGSSKPPSRYPWDNHEDEMKYRRWEENYKRSSEKYAVCNFITTLGSGHIHPDVEKILSIHDRFCCSDQGRKLA